MNERDRVKKFKNGDDFLKYILKNLYKQYGDLPKNIFKDILNYKMNHIPIKEIKLSDILDIEKKLNELKSTLQDIDIDDLHREYARQKDNTVTQTFISYQIHIFDVIQKVIYKQLIEEKQKMKELYLKQKQQKNKNNEV